MATKEDKRTENAVKIGAVGAGVGTIVGGAAGVKDARKVPKATPFGTGLCFKNGLTDPFYPDYENHINSANEFYHKAGDAGYHKRLSRDRAEIRKLQANSNFDGTTPSKAESRQRLKNDDVYRSSKREARVEGIKEKVFINAAKAEEVAKYALRKGNELVRKAGKVAKKGGIGAVVGTIAALGTAKAAEDGYNYYLKLKKANEAKRAKTPNSKSSVKGGARSRTMEK